MLGPHSVSTWKDQNGGQQMLRAFGSENQVMKYIKDVLGYTMYQMKNDQGVLVWDYECVYTNDKRYESVGEENISNYADTI